MTSCTSMKTGVTVINACHDAASTSAYAGMQVETLEASCQEHQQAVEASQAALAEAEAAHAAALQQKAGEAAQLVEAQNTFYQQYEELTASYQELQGHYETVNTQLQVR